MSGTSSVAGILCLWVCGLAIAASADPNNLTGDISIGVTGYSATTKRVFVLMDGQYIGEIVYFDSNVPLLLESDKYLNGRHSIKVVAVDANRNVTLSRVFDVNFGNTFYNIIAPEFFDPNTGYKLMGFHNGSGSFEAKLTDHADRQLWSNTYSGQSVNITIPPAAFGNAQLCKLSIKETGSGMMAAAGSSDECMRKILKPFVKENFSGVKMVLLLPNPELIKKSKLSLVCTIISSCEARGVPYGVVYHKDNTPENWKYLFRPPPSGSKKDIYYGGHANSHVGEVQRTHLECWKKGQKIKAFSYTTQYEPDAQPLPDDWDKKGFDLRELGLKDYDQIRIGWFDGCRTAGRETKTPGGMIIKTPYTDLAETFGFLSLAAQQHQRSIFLGWRIDTQSYPGWHWLGDCFSAANHGQELIWKALGDGRTIDDALSNLSSYGADETIMFILWGEDECRLDDGTGHCKEDDNNFVLYGVGNIWAMRLKWEE